MKNIYLTIVLTTWSFFTFGQWGELDPTFGINGKLTFNLGSGFENANDIIFQNDGKLIVIGSGTETATSIMLARFKPGGTLDATFGTGGKTLVKLGSNTINNGVKGAFQSDGKIIVGCKSGNGAYNDFVCLRFTSDGMLDESFATDGIFSFNFGGTINDIYDVKVLDDDKIILAGNAGQDIDNDFALIKLTPDGAFDNDFGVNGKVQYGVTDKFDKLKAISITRDGKIIGAGHIWDENRVLVSSLIQFNADGTVDSTFGTNGLVTSTPGPHASYFNDVVINEDNTIVAAGALDYDSQHDFLAIKFNEDGSIFTSFADNGIFIKGYVGNSDYAFSFILQPDAKLVFVGSRGIWPESDFALLRITADGALDNTFGDNGLVTTDFDGGFDYATGSAMQSDGKIIACGSAGFDSDYQMAISRYSTGLPLGIDDRAFNDLKIYAYPNPVVHELTLQFELEQNDHAEINIYDISGKKVKEMLANKNITKGKHELKTDLSDLKPGLFFIQIKTSKTMSTIKLNKL